MNLLKTIRNIADVITRSHWRRSTLVLYQYPEFVYLVPIHVRRSTRKTKNLFATFCSCYLILGLLLRGLCALHTIAKQAKRLTMASKYHPLALSFPSVFSKQDCSLCMVLLAMHNKTTKRMAVEWSSSLCSHVPRACYRSIGSSVAAVVRRLFSAPIAIDCTKYWNLHYKLLYGKEITVFLDPFKVRLDFILFVLSSSFELRSLHNNLFL